MTEQHPGDPDGRRPRARRRRAVFLVPVFLLAASLAWLLVPTPEDQQVRPSGTPDERARWAAFAGSEAEVEADDGIADDDGGSVARPQRDGRVVLWRRAGLRPPGSATDGESWRVRVWVRSSRRQRVVLRVLEREENVTIPRGRVARVVPPEQWTPLGTTVRLDRAGGSLGLRLVLPQARAGDRVAVDEEGLQAPGEAAGPGTLELSNGCALSARGVPECGALLGASHGGNTDPSDLEEDLGTRLGLRRTYWGPGSVDEAVSTARGDLAAGRLPWISFKLPESWEEMDSEEGESWVRGVAARLAALDGPVWVAFHHEPEGDGDIAAWKRMQERFVPVVRETAANVAYTVVLTGYAQFYGSEEYRLDAMFPDGDVDVAGFDIYNQYGVVRNGELNTEGTDLDEQYFAEISTWAEERGVAWGLAETGYSDLALEEYPGWVQETYDALRRRGGVALAYFDSPLNSKADWTLDDETKREDFRRALESAPQFPPRVPGTPTTEELE